MSTHQTHIGNLLADLWGALEGDEQQSVSKRGGFFRDFYRTTWGLLPLESEKGSALATASCIPLWELLNCVSSTYGNFDPLQKAKLIQLLSGMYPKSKDRRTTYQQLTRFARGVGVSVPLSTETPSATECVKLLTVSGRLPTLLKNIDLDGADVETVKGQGLDRIVAAVKSLVDVTLPSTAIYWSDDEKRLCVKCGNEEPCSFVALASVVWRCLVFAQLCNIPEKKQLHHYLTSSGWSSKTVERGGKRTTYASLFSPLTTMCMVSLSLNSLTPSVAADNVPLVDPHIVEVILHREGTVDSVADQLDSAGSTRSVKTELSLPSVNAAEKANADTYERLTSTISSEVDFLGSSPSCRDCDRVTLLCRDVLFSTLSAQKPPTKGGVSLVHAALFSRKRSRDGSSLSEGPSFTPVGSSISDMLNDEKTGEKNTLERLALSWQTI